MGGLFKADIFSVSRPIFSPVPEHTDRVIRDVSRIFYPGSMSSIDRIEQFGGNEINSNNFKLQTADGSYLLKRLPEKTDVQLRRRQLSLMIWLNEKGGAVPRVVRNKSGEGIVASQDGSHWCLFDFVDGDFFKGGEQELLSTAFEIGRLQRALSTLPDSLKLPKKWDYGTASDAEAFRAASAGKQEWPKIFGKETSVFLSENWDLVLRVSQELEEKNTQIQSAPVGMCHCDLHPHNILMNNGKLSAFIDFESFTLMPVSASLGYAGYKLIKQHTVSQGFSETFPDRIFDAAQRFLNGVHEGGGSASFDLETFRLLALAELFRRLLIVFRLNFVEGNNEWNHVLPMHLAGLGEIDIIFGRHTRA